MEDLLLKWQRCHFEQANETSLATTEWKQKLMQTEVQHAIQEGTFHIPESLPLEVHQLLKNMKRPKCIQKDIPNLTTYSAFRQFIKITKEKTSSSPSGRHYGHYKAMMEGKPIFLQVIHGILDLAV